MSVNKDGNKEPQGFQERHQSSAWMLAQCARLHDRSGDRLPSTLFAAIVASLLVFGLQ
tara:strand:- start:47 stop:220 length:174 start_codon:yes stop_codon:yes gene_type:complete